MSFDKFSCETGVLGRTRVAWSCCFAGSSQSIKIMGIWEHIKHRVCKQTPPQTPHTEFLRLLHDMVPHWERVMMQLPQHLWPLIGNVSPGIQNLGGGPLHWRTEINMLTLGCTMGFIMMKIPTSGLVYNLVGLGAHLPAH